VNKSDMLWGYCKALHENDIKPTVKLLKALGLVEGRDVSHTICGVVIEEWERKLGSRKPGDPLPDRNRRSVLQNASALG
jgi:hypothetical protein